MKVLFIGDIVSQQGCDFVRQKLPSLKHEMQISVVVANGENSAVGNGILPSSAESLLNSGVDVITTGNHVFKRFEILKFLESSPQVIRPANFPQEAAGSGVYLYDGGFFRLAVVSLMGTSYMEPLACPFDTMDKIIKGLDCPIVVDFHAEATGEKKALGYYLDGRVAAVLGTHTHVQTADEQILPSGTGFMTDVGMTGPVNSVLGVEPQCVISRLKTHMPTRFEIADGECAMDCVLLDISDKTGLCDNITRMRVV